MKGQWLIGLALFIICVLGCATATPESYLQSGGRGQGYRCLEAPPPQHDSLLLRRPGYEHHVHGG